MANVTNVITLNEYATKHDIDIDIKRLRRLARKNEFPGDVQPFKFGGKNGLWCIDASAPVIVLPEKSARGTRRADGRQRMIVYCNPTERDAITAVVGVNNVVDPRVASQKRRDARKLNDTNDADNAERVAEQMFNDARDNNG